MSPLFTFEPSSTNKLMIFPPTFGITCTSDWETITPVVEKVSEIVPFCGFTTETAVTGGLVLEISSCCFFSFFYSITN